MVTKRALEIFNCNPTNPDDGNLYTGFTSLKCGGGGLCKCYDSTDIQAGLIVWAVLAVLIYTIGFPMSVFFIVRKNKTAIKIDQLLRALDTGDSERTNPHYFVRRRYHKMYYHFKPVKYIGSSLLLEEKQELQQPVCCFARIQDFNWRQFCSCCLLLIFGK